MIHISGLSSPVRHQPRVEMIRFVTRCKRAQHGTLQRVPQKQVAMEHIHEPQEVDFYVDPRPLTAEERGRISEYIKKDKKRGTNRATAAPHRS